MAASSSALLPLLLLLLISSQTRAQSADAPAPAGPPNVTAILEKGGQFTTFMRLITQTQIANQINTQVNSSTEGMTVFAPTDNAFNNLKPGVLNSLSDQDQVRLLLGHVLYKYFPIKDLLTVSNPVRTQATAEDGTAFGLNFTGQGSQVNVSSGIVTTQVNNALTTGPPLAVYQVDAVLLPEALFGVKPPSSAPAPTKKAAGDSNATDSSEAPSAAANDNSAAAGAGGAGLGLVAGLGLLCMAAFY